MLLFILQNIFTYFLPAPILASDKVIFFNKEIEGAKEELVDRFQQADY